MFGEPCDESSKHSFDISTDQALEKSSHMFPSEKLH